MKSDEDRQVDCVRQTIKDFCLEFKRNPYWCYTEHGIHAHFYRMLLNKFDNEKLATSFKYLNSETCYVQKEYPTNEDLNKKRRQHWDIALLRRPNGNEKYDHLPLMAVVEFGLNASEKHLREDIRRVSHTKANVIKKFIVHLYRISRAGGKISRRDLSDNSKLFLKKDVIKDIVDDAVKENKSSDVEVFYAVYHNTESGETCAWDLTEEKELQYKCS